LEDVNVRRLLRVGGISALAVGVLYLATIALFATVGAPPSSGEAWLHYLAGKTTTWWIILGLSVVTDLLYIPVGMALFVALQALNRNLMLIATSFVALFIVLDLAVTWTSYASLITLAGSYASAATEAQRASLVAAAGYPASVLASHLEPVYSIATLSFGILLIGLVMLKGVFNKVTSYLALAAGVLGLVSITGLAVAIIANALAATVWVLLVGYRLYRLGRL
jgi:hypothetical protein